MDRLKLIEQWYRRYAQLFGGQDLEVEEGLVFPESQEPLQQPVFMFLPGLESRPWHDASRFEWVARLEAHFASLRGELDALLEKRTSFSDYLEPGRPQLHDAGEWKRFPLTDTRTHAPIAENVARLPETWRLLSSIERLERSFISVSALAPGTHVTPHCGHTNAKLRCHLGLRVPAGCEMRVGQETRSWEEGRCLLFDDSYEHEVWNRGTGTRYVLLFDVYHPDLSDEEVALLKHWQRRMAELSPAGAPAAD